MKMAAFEHHRPASLPEALALLAELGPDAKVVAGGQSLVPLMAMRLSTPAHLVDVTSVEGLDGITVADDGSVELGAAVRQGAAERSPVVAERVPLLAAALPWIGHRAIRNRGTVCGSLAHADPAAELPAVARALDAVLVAHSTRGRREIPATDFFEGMLSTCLADDELLTAVRFPARSAGGSSVAEVARRHGDFALVGVACSLALDDAGAVGSAALALFGVSDTPVRARAAESVLIGSPPSSALFAEASAAVTAQVHPPGDVHASAAYRRHVAGVLTRRALAVAADGSVTREDAA